MVRGRVCQWALLLSLVWWVALWGIPGQSRAQDYDPNMLSYGIYWFGLNDAKQKFVPGEPNPYFDPTKPTLIFVHGWQPGLSANYPPNFTYRYFEGIWPRSINTANAWIEAGWNVGIFFWNQFSDEAVVTDAEAKIWVNDGPKGMRWRKADGSYEEAPPGTPSAGELFYQAYVDALGNSGCRTAEIRIVGHSLGGQMAVRLTKLIEDGISAGEVPSCLRPTRVVLLDPYWSLGSKDYLGEKTTADIVRGYVAELLARGILFEWYRSSSLTVEPKGLRNEEMERMMLYAEMSPDFAGDQMSKHCAAYHLYFWSFAFPGPSACMGNDCVQGPGKLLAKMDNARLAALMRSDYFWRQSDGRATHSPADDLYEPVLRADAPYTITQLVASPGGAVGETILVTATVRNVSQQPAEGVLVSFGASRGEISPRVVCHDGLAITAFSSSLPGTVYLWATTEGEGGEIQAELTLTLQSRLYLPFVSKP